MAATHVPIDALFALVVNVNVDGRLRSEIVQKVERAAPNGRQIVLDSTALCRVMTERTKGSTITLS